MSERFVSLSVLRRDTLKALVALELVGLLGALLVSAREPAPLGPPKTRTDDFKEVLHGVEIADPYRWLEDRNNPETQAWIDQQNRYTEPILSSLPGREALRERLTELIKIDTLTVPRERNGRLFFYKRLRTQELPVLYLRRGLKANDEVLIDPHPMSADRNTSVSLVTVSRDGKTVVYGVRRGGEDEVVIHLLDVDTRKNLPDGLPKGRYFGVSLKPDKSGFYYSLHGAEGTRVRYHAMGTEPSRDVEVFGKAYGPDKGISAFLSEDGRTLVAEVSYGAAGDRTDVYFRDEQKQGPLKPLVNDIPARFSAKLGGNQLFLHTNWKAPKGRILAVDLGQPARERWREIIPEGDAVIEDFYLAGGKVFVSYLKNVQPFLKVFEPDGRHARDVELPGVGSLTSVSGRWESREVFFGFQSFHIPHTIYHSDVSRGSQEVWARLKVPVDSDKFEVKQVWYESKDKTRVPMFIMHRKGIKLDGSNPALLTGYGGFNVSETPVFRSSAVVWAERGGVFAAPNLRGGGEFGEEWHEAGKREKKQNVFDDFIAAAEWLINNGYTRPAKLAISGQSNGGLLVGAALTQRPDLFQAVLCNYPLLDMVRYHKFLIAKLWVSEYGSSDNPKEFAYLHAYSPYHHVKPGTKYPAVLFFTGDGDTRVDPLHARKMAALVQSVTASDRPVLLHYDTKTGHTNAVPISKQIDDLVDQLSFLFWQLEPEPASRPRTGD